MPHLGYKFHDIQKNYLLMFAQKAASETPFVQMQKPSCSDRQTEDVSRFSD